MNKEMHLRKDSNLVLTSRPFQLLRLKKLLDEVFLFENGYVQIAVRLMHLENKMANIDKGIFDRDMSAPDFCVNLRASYAVELKRSVNELKVDCNATYCNTVGYTWWTEKDNDSGELVFGPGKKKELIRFKSVHHFRLAGLIKDKLNIDDGIDDNIFNKGEGKIYNKDRTLDIENSERPMTDKEITDRYELLKNKIVYVRGIIQEHNNG